MGNRAPVNVSFFPESFGIASDADDTATIYAVLLDHARLDGGEPVNTRFDRFFVDWRDLGQVPRRNDASWLPQSSGAFLTWLAYRDDSADPRPNDVDLIVNVNVLYALGRFDRLDTPGAADAVRIINAAIEEQAHVRAPRDISLYYPDNLALHYCVVRAFREGGVSALGPAVDLLTQDLVTSAEFTPEGHCFWDRGDPHLNTAFAVLALSSAGSDGQMVDAAAAYLLGEQDPVTGAWEEGAFFRGRFDGGAQAVWVSKALTTAMAMQSLCRHRLQEARGAAAP